jgi:hypothetical protein
MKLKTLTLAAAALATSFAMMAPAAAQEVTPWPDMMLRMVGMNKDGMVTRQAFIDAMAKMWDEKHAAMSKTDPTMKPGMMNRTQFMAFAKNWIDPGKIGGN